MLVVVPLVLGWEHIVCISGLKFHAEMKVNTTVKLAILYLNFTVASALACFLASVMFYLMLA